jgi:hypothetical protein
MLAAKDAENERLRHILANAYANLRAENGRLRVALERIVENTPWYGKEIARAALAPPIQEEP